MLIPNYDLALKSIQRVLQQNGQFAITSWNSHGHWDYLVRAARQDFQNP
jgi:ubiquinone/menaquinone biosynthesis C-methylase UbiE